MITETFWRFVGKLFRSKVNLRENILQRKKKKKQQKNENKALQTLF